MALAGGLGTASAEIRYTAYHRCLPDFIGNLARAAYEARNAKLAALTTPEAIGNRQAWVRQTFWTLVGGEPQRTPLNIRTLGSIERRGYRLDKIVYESQPGLMIPANLYVPTGGAPPYPGVLFQLGHSLDGKAAEPYQKCCQGLARLGYVVLSFDTMGQGERTYYPKPGERRTRLDSADEEHSRPGRLMLLTGDTATRLQTWDAVRSLDVLAAHPSVDPKRLGSTGQSGGATLTMMLAAVDDRLACAAVSCGNTENFACAGFRPPGSTDDAEQNFVGGSALGFERWDTLYPLAPKPLWIGVSARDYFGTYSPQYLVSGREEFAKLRSVYERLGHGGAVEWYETPVPHALSHDLRVQIYNFFERRLKGSTKQIVEPEVAPEPENTIQVGPTGNAVRDFKSTTPLRLKPTLRPATDWKQSLQVEMPVQGVKPNVLGTANAEGCTIDAVEFQSAHGVVVPAWVFVPRRGGREKVLLLLEPRGRNARWREGDLYHQLAKEGWTVCAFDIRGVGDMSPEVSGGNPFYTRPHSEDEAWAWASLMLGRPMLGQRVGDILAVAAQLKGTSRTVLAALGHTTVPATIAGVFNTSLEIACAPGGLPSWNSLLEKEDYTEPFSNFVPGILADTDLPALRKQLGQRLKTLPSWDRAGFLQL